LDTKDFKIDGTNIITNSSGSQLGNVGLKPELLAEVEFGLEANLFDNRLNAEISYYDRKTTDLIITRPLDPATGYSSTRTNIGEISSKGWEVDLSADWLRGEKFNWNTSVNYMSTQSIVEDLGDDTDQIVYAGFTNLGNAAIPGLPLTSIIGSSVSRDAQGNPIVEGNGTYATNYDTEYKNNPYSLIGDANPDFIANLSNTITYGNLSLSFLFNATIGGDMYSPFNSTLLSRGLTTDTAGPNFNRELAFLLPGVLPDSTPNNKMINNSTFTFSTIFYASELETWDASVLRLSELSLTYDIPQKWLESTPFGAISVSAQGFNLWYDAYNTPPGSNFDPNIAGTGVGNGSGFEFFNGVSSKRYGVSLKLTF